MTPALALFVLAACAPEPPAVDNEPAADEAEPVRDVAFPAELQATGFRPLAETFGYDPELASQVYGHDLQFVNLDPAAYGSDEDPSVKALGYLITHPAIDFTGPFWARYAAAAALGTPAEQVAGVGVPPSPYRAQIDVAVSLPTLEGEAVEVHGRLSTTRRPAPSCFGGRRLQRATST